MIKISNQPLRQNPFTVYRDPETGIWQVVPTKDESSACSSHASQTTTSAQSA